MEQTAVGRVVVAVKIENLGDLWLAEKSVLPTDQVRSVEVPDAVIDTAASTLSLPSRLITQLGLQPLRPRKARTSDFDGRSTGRWPC
jgi:hypothetical protein